MWKCIDMKYYLYWIHRTCQIDITSEGYVGVTQNPHKRFNIHRNNARKGSFYHVHLAIRKYDDIQYDILCVGDVNYIRDLEYKLRSNLDIGWNMRKGGGITDIEISELRRKSFKIISEKLMKVSRFDIIKMLLDYHIRGYSAKNVGEKFGISKSTALRHIKDKGNIYPDLKVYRKIIKKLRVEPINNLQKLSEDMYNNIIDDKLSGLRERELKNKYQLSLSSIYRICIGGVEITKKFESYRGNIIALIKKEQECLRN